jgi:hypothetical protein
MFRRTQKTPEPSVTTDPNNLQLFPIHPQPFSAMPTQSGLGLSHLDQLQTLMTPLFKDVNHAAGPALPSAFQYQFEYGGGAKDPTHPDIGFSTDRLFESFQIGMVGLGGVNPIPIAYSDWTVTVDWANKLQATLGQGLPYAYFTTPAGGQMQLTTQTPGAPGKRVTIIARDSTGKEVNPGETHSGR